MKPIDEVAREYGLESDQLVHYGPHVAKLSWKYFPKALREPPKGKLVLVTAMSPTPKGEGKTTMAIGLAGGLRAEGQKAALALRQPSLGPLFGAKGGATGGGRSTLLPSDRINLHFTGDLHAITSAHNLLSAMVDHALYFGLRGSARRVDPRRIVWPRVMDMGDRALREIVVGLGGTANGLPRQDGFEITAASEVMASLCLSRDVADLKERLGRLVVAYDWDGEPITAGDLGAVGSMAAILRDAVVPNLVQSADGVLAFVHGGPFGNIAHGCNSVMASRTALSLADFVVTEAGFAFDLGAEKFFDIKCRTSGLWPSAVVLVATVQALRYHGGDRKFTASGAEAVAALKAGMANLDGHLEGARAFGFEPVLAINVHANDSKAELDALDEACRERKLRAARCTAYVDGAEGARELARKVIEAARTPPAPKFLYGLEQSPADKIRAVATTLYGAGGVVFTKEAQRDLERVDRLGFAKLPVCIAKTHLSLSDDPAAIGRPRGFQLTVRSVRERTGAGFLLVLTGDIVTMPGLPREPNAYRIDLQNDGEVTGLA